MKLGVGSASGSIGVFSEGIHSALDLVSAAIAFFTIREAGKPADDEHPYGHGKFETLSALFEAMLLVFAAGLIIYHSVEDLRHPHPVAHQNLALATIAISMVVSYFVYRHNHVAGQETESLAIQGNALHFLADTITSIGVFVGLLILKLTGWLPIDPLIGIGVATYILYISFKQVKIAVAELSDTQLPDAEIAKIREILGPFEGQMAEIHELRTRKSGAIRHIDYHLVVCRWMTVQESHQICDAMEERILTEFSNASVSIHVEPCGSAGHPCYVGCPPQNKNAISGASS